MSDYGFSVDDALMLKRDLLGLVTDEDAARHAREQYRESGIPSLAPDSVIAGHLEDGERVFAARLETQLGRIDEETRSAVREDGALYVTDRRLVHIGDEALSIPLAEIEELTMTEDRILVTLLGARGITLDAPEPRQLRVLIAAARAAIR